MNLNQIAMDALDEVDREESSSGQVKRVDNGDGTVTMSISFELDPKVVAEKAKAIGKGLKREDLTDELPLVDDVEEGTDAKDSIRDAGDWSSEDDDEWPEDDGDPYNDTPSTDEMFSSALDELDAEVEDAKIGRHGLSPLENCRAKDPKFCPYHGQKAWQSQVEADLQAAGVTGATVTVTEDEHKSHLADSGTGRYTIDVKCAAGDEQKVAGVLQGYLQMNGVKDPTYVPAKQGKTARGTHPAIPGRGVVQNPGGADVNFVRDRKAKPDDKFGTIQELFDDLMDSPDVDYANPDQMKLFDEISDILDNQAAALVDPTTHELVNPADQQKYDGLEHEAYDKYHQLSAMVALPNVKTMQDVDNESSANRAKFDAAVKSLDDTNSRINGVKKALGWKPNQWGTFTKSSKLSVAGHEDSMKWLQNVGHFTKELMTQADAEMAKAKQSGDVNQARRWLKQQMYATQNADFMNKSIAGEEKKYLQAIYDAESAAGNPNLSAAFPNGRPQ